MHHHFHSVGHHHGLKCSFILRKYSKFSNYMLFATWVIQYVSEVLRTAVKFLNAVFLICFKPSALKKIPISDSIGCTELGFVIKLLVHRYNCSQYVIFTKRSVPNSPLLRRQDYFLSKVCYIHINGNYVFGETISSLMQVTVVFSVNDINLQS